MDDILVFSAPASVDIDKHNVTRSLGDTCGWLRDEGYDFDQKSLAAECRYLNRYRFRSDFVDLSVFEPGRVIDYLQGGEDEEISREANKLADMLSIDSYDTIVWSMDSEGIVSMKDWRLLTVLPILKERTRDDQLIVIRANVSERVELTRLSFVDYVVDGDVEIPLGNIFAHEFEGEDLKVEPGVMCERDGELLRGSPYQHPMDMKSKPYFERGILEKFAKTSAFDIPIIPYKLGRGCAQDCSFCNIFPDQKYQYKSVDKVVEELKELKEELGTKNVWITDANLFNDPDYIKEMAVRLQEEDVDISWGGLSIIVSRDQEFFDTLAEGGFTAVQHGIESASNSVLHRMQKHQTRAMIESTLEKEYKAGIKPFAFFITDYIGETWEEYFETVDFVKQNPYIAGGDAFSFMIFPDGSQPIYRNPEEFNVELEKQRPDEWENNTEAANKSWMKSHKFNISFKELDHPSRNVGRQERRDLKKRYLNRLIELHFTLKNFGMRNPVKFLKMQLRKLRVKDYPDITHYFV